MHQVRTEEEACPPESAEIKLDKYEGKVIMVQGYDGGGWIYSASIRDKAGSILTAVAKKVYAEDNKK